MMKYEQYLSGGPVSLRPVGFSLIEADGGGVDGLCAESSSSVPSASSSSLATGGQPLSLGLLGPSSSTQSPSSAWSSVPGPAPSTPSSPVSIKKIVCISNATLHWTFITILTDKLEQQAVGTVRISQENGTLFSTLTPPS